MLQENKIPIVVGVTGHRNIVDEDKPEIKAQVIESLKEIQSLCKDKGGDDTPVIMLNAFAQGADMLCAEAAFELGIDVYAVLPCKEEKYKQSFNLHRIPFIDAGITSGEEYEKALLKDEADIRKLDDYLSKVQAQGGRVIYSPDIEKNKAWIRKTKNIDDDSYEYRQLGIYMAEHSHILLALWDGKPAQEQYGCGTVEVIKFALEHKFLDKDKLFKPGMINDSAVVWIKSRRQGDAQTDIGRKWLISDLVGGDGKPNGADNITLDSAPAFLKDIISKTVKYNSEKFDIPRGRVKLWEKVDELDEYRKHIRYYYAKADELSYTKNQKMYNLFILLLAIVGTIVACTFLIYDDASLPYMIFPCTVAVGTVIFLALYGKKRAYHKNYICYRALAEALRIQFYMSMCLTGDPTVTNVCDFYAWSQKADMIWINKAIQSLGIIYENENIKVDKTKVIDVWIGNNAKPKGQLMYHNEKKSANAKKAKLFKNLSTSFRVATTVALPQGVSKLGNNVFRGCLNLKKLIIPVSLTEIGDNCFAQCKNLKDLFYEGKLTEFNRIKIGKGLIVDFNKWVKDFMMKSAANMIYYLQHNNAPQSLLNRLMEVNLHCSDGLVKIYFDKGVIRRKFG